MVRLQCRADVLVQCQPPIGEDRASVAILPHRMRIVGYKNYVGPQHALAECLGASAAEPLVANLGHLVDQVDVEIDSRQVAKASRARIPAE